MWNDRIRLCERVEGDWKELGAEDRSEAKLAFEAIDDDPIAGAPLFEPFRGIWSYRRDSIRIYYRIAPEARVVVVMKVERMRDDSE